MVAIATLVGKNGLQTWLLQRITAVVLGVYLLVVLGFWLRSGVTFYTWQAFIHSPLGRPSALLALLCMLVHAWIGVWTVTTDYLPLTALRFSVQMLCISALMAYCYWGIKIIWL